MTGRRKFIAGIAALGAAGMTRAQGKPRRVAILLGSAADEYGRAQVDALRQGLRRAGWEEGRNLELLVRLADGKVEAMRAALREIVAARPEVIAVSTATALRETRLAAGTTPIVFWGVSDPVGNKFVTSLAHPGANVTGFSLYEYDMSGRWLQLLKEAVPHVREVLVLMNSANPNWPAWSRALEGVAPSLGMTLVRPTLHDVREVRPEIEHMGGRPGVGLLSLPDPFLDPIRETIVATALEQRIPSIYGTTTYAESGGLIAYGVDRIDPALRSATYVDRILRGEKPGNLPVQAPTRFELVINLRTAAAIGVTIPQTLLVRADKVVRG